MDISFKIEGLDRLDKASKAAVAEINKQMDIALYASAKKIEGEAKRSILSGKKTGRLYQRRTVAHQASAPGEAPASDTGRLVNSISAYLVKGRSYAVVTAGRGVALYAAMLEFGTSKIAPRPFMFPAAEKSRQWIQDRLNKAVRDAVVKVSKRK